MAEDEKSSIIYHYHFGKQLGYITLENLCLNDNEDKLILNDNEDKLNLHGHDLVFVQNKNAMNASIEGKLFIVDNFGNQVFAFDASFGDNSLDITLQNDYYPLRRFSGKALTQNYNLQNVKEQIVYYDLADRWLPIVAHHKPRYFTEGMVVTNLFDGKEPGCVWHRIIMDAVIPDGTSIEIASRAADSEELLQNTPWLIEPSPYLRGNGSEIPYYDFFPKNEAKKDSIGSWELLIQNTCGRFLQLRLILRGTGYSTPQLFALRIYYPRFSYLLEYLPTVYQQDKQSAHFLERYLANIEGIFTTLEGKIAEVQQLFDVRLVPEEYLEWLASWLGISLDPSLDERRQRLFLNHAFELFRQRGTLPGLIRYLRLALDPCVDESLFTEDVTAYLWPSEISPQNSPFTIRIVEHYLTRLAPGVTFGDESIPDIPRLTSTNEPWSTEQGSSYLHRLFREYLKIRFSENETKLSDFVTNDMQVNSLDLVKLSPVIPKNEKVASVWKDFIRSELGFNYAEITDSDLGEYQRFLQHRYRQINNLNTTYRQQYSNFLSVPLPAENDMPTGGQRLYDWIQFVSLFIPVHRHAHKFTVLIPIDLEFDSDVEIEQKITLANRIINQEKPGHTHFEIKPYWAAFRVGEARVGFDTILGHGSRFYALKLGYSRLAESYLGWSHPWDVNDRFIANRDRLGSKLII